MTKYQKRHYEDTAQILNECFMEWPADHETALKLQCVYEAFSNLYTDDNPKFNRRWFEEAVFKRLESPYPPIQILPTTI